MGVCVSREQQPHAIRGVLTCQHCQQCSHSAMHLMTPGELRFWITEGDYVSCRKCHVQHQAQERLRSRERTLLKRLQEELFPKMRRKLSMKKIASGQQWNGTASFMEGYRPSRRVQDLEQQLARWEESEQVVAVLERPPSGVTLPAPNGRRTALSSVPEPPGSA